MGSILKEVTSQQVWVLNIWKIQKDFYLCNRADTRQMKSNADKYTTIHDDSENNT